MSNKDTLPLILVVDDSPADVELLQQRLTDGGVKNPVAAFRSGDSATEFLFHNALSTRTPIGVLPCLLLINLKMPNMGGIELLQWVRKQPALGRATIALVSDSDDPHDVERDYEFGADHFLTKYPVADVLAQIVADAMQRFSAV